MSETTLVSAPTACERCEGSRAEGMRWVGGKYFELVACSACCCEICGQPTDTPPECLSCAARDEAAAKRRADR